MCLTMFSPSHKSVPIYFVLCLSYVMLHLANSTSPAIKNPATGMYLFATNCNKMISSNNFDFLEQRASGQVFLLKPSPEHSNIYYIQCIESHKYWTITDSYHIKLDIFHRGQENFKQQFTFLHNEEDDDWYIFVNNQAIEVKESDDDKVQLNVMSRTPQQRFKLHVYQSNVSVANSDGNFQSMLNKIPLNWWVKFIMVGCCFVFFACIIIKVIKLKYNKNITKKMHVQINIENNNTTKGYEINRASMFDVTEGSSHNSKQPVLKLAQKTMKINENNLKEMMSSDLFDEGNEITMTNTTNTYNYNI
eukprot:323287_1